MNSSHERGQGKCAFADEFQTLIKRCSSGLVCLQSEAIFGEDLRPCLHAGLMTACVLHCFYVCACASIYVVIELFKCFMQFLKFRARGLKKKSAGCTEQV